MTVNMVPTESLHGLAMSKGESVTCREFLFFLVCNHLTNLGGGVGVGVRREDMV